MRKLKPAELVVLAAAMSIGGLSEAQELEELPITNLNSVDVYGVHYTFGNAQISYQIGPPLSSYPGGAPRPAVPSLLTQAKALDCAKKYSGWSLPPGVVIGYSANYAWENGTGITTYTPTNTAPFGNWTYVAGLYAGPPANRIWIFPEGFGSFQELMITLAHELAHAGGITNEAVAESQAQAAYSQYLSDSGAKCGGLAPP